jgi:transcriptional regulator with XRE-family HTH domain
METRRSVGEQLRNLREDAGISRAAVAKVAGVHSSYVRLVESGQREASIGTLSRLSVALGADLSLRLRPNTRPPIRDHIQARMVESLLGFLPPDWNRYVEVPVRRPVRGIIDVVIVRPAARRVVAIEAHSELRRLEQQLRWAAEESEALPSATIWPALTSIE